jgi:hypothetical protein
MSLGHHSPTVYRFHLQGGATHLRMGWSAGWGRRRLRLSLFKKAHLGERSPVSPPLSWLGIEATRKRSNRGKKVAGRHAALRGRNHRRAILARIELAKAWWPSGLQN